MPRRPLDVLVADVASRLMGVDATTVDHAYRVILRDLVEYFDIDTCFLRHNDHDRRATILVAEWPPREHIPDPDPLGVVFFDDADPMFAPAEHQREVGIFRPAGSGDGARGVGSALASTTMVSVPLVAGGRPTGTLGFVRFGDRDWPTEDIAALKAIATLLAQLQERVSAEDRLRFLALHDDLTGLANRRSLTAHLDGRLAIGHPGPVAILYVDLDRLKALNDFLGHVAGDQYIQAIATRLRERMVPGDFVARLGGDEFVIVLGGSHSRDDAIARAAVVRELISEQVELGHERVSRNASIGVYAADPGTVTATEAMLAADRAAMEAKAAGGNAVVAFTDTMRAESDLRNDIEIYLQSAIADGGLLLDFQPEIDLRTGSITAVEALPAWNHPTRGRLRSADFVPVAEGTNLGGQLGRWVIDNACAALARWRRDGAHQDVTMRTNVSPAQLLGADFVQSVAETLLRHDVPGDRLCLEVTEVAVVHDTVRTRIVLGRLQELGIRIAIDDFGTGFSSLLHLKELPFDALKIDSDFVVGLGTEADDLVIVHATVELARALELEIVAEGLQSERAARILVDLGCFHVQGPYVSDPVDEDTFVGLLSSSTPLVTL
ncbi:putative bifunctional diguanylate cyclase/phosphodiesterase [Actinomycetes bacterium M1A6_2h]